jgi:hypothetical protein
MNATNDNQLPMPEPESDAAAAFHRLADQVGALETTMRGLVGKIDDTPDPTETLGVIAAEQHALRKTMQTLAERPAITLTPEAMAREIANAGKTARAADQVALAKAIELHGAAVQSLHKIVGNAHSKADQKYLQRVWGAGGAALGLLVGIFLPVMIARGLPASWQLPERLAVNVMGEPNMWAAGQRLMRAGNPQTWRAILIADAIIHDNDKALAECDAAALKAGQPIKCTINVKPRPGGG